MLKLYNTLSRKKEAFNPRKRKVVDIFVCGITPYDFAHLGHARTYIVFDMIVKYLKKKGYDVFYLQNVTDIDDKIIKRAKEKKISPQKLARDFEKEYLKDMKVLNINGVTKYARATDYIKEIISQVERLLKKGFAYQAEDGIYYDISKFKNYGKLSRRTVLQAEDAVSRIDEAKKKRNKGDFCLWKKSKIEEPKWESPFGYQGRPGWHIEDTAITEKFFGPQYDIHGGARDLIFPHHEAEIAQIEAISGKKPMVKCWLHTGFLTVKGVKMSKSIGNFITIKDFLNKHSARILRLFVLKTHYRSPIDYSEKEIKQVKSQLERIDEFLDKLNKIKDSDRKKEKDVGCRTSHIKEKIVKPLVLRTQKEFEKVMDDDFNTSKAIAAIFDLVNKGNSLIAQNKLNRAEAKNILEVLRKIDKVFDFMFWGKRAVLKIPDFIKKMVKEREKAREAKNWKLADEIRKKIEDLGYQIKDTKEGPKIKK